jgi:NAD(P)-dependent dehydrogenase (short-subunit alcohol dehydrogenase family)
MTIRARPAPTSDWPRGGAGSTRLGAPETGHRGLTRRQLFLQQAALGAGYIGASALAGGSLAETAVASTGVAVDPQFYPLPSFAPEIDLRDKVAVITGASTGIGRAAGEALAARGVRVIGTSRDVASVGSRPQFTLLDLNLAKTKSIDAFLRKLKRRLGASGRVNILINNAGRGIIGPVVPPKGSKSRYFARLDKGIRTDYTGHITLTQKMLPLLPRSGYARVYFTVSADAYLVATGATAYLHFYTAMKRALLAFANAWWSLPEVTHANIGVATVNPYVVNTRFVDNLIRTVKPSEGSPLASYVETMRAVWAGGLPAAMAGEAYWQLLSTRKPPVNVAVGSADEPYATMGANALFASEMLAENDAAAIRLEC